MDELTLKSRPETMTMVTCAATTIPPKKLTRLLEERERRLGRQERLGTVENASMMWYGCKVNTKSAA
jgi:hypothetical protein